MVSWRGIWPSRLDDDSAADAEALARKERAPLWIADATQARGRARTPTALLRQDRGLPADLLFMFGSLT